MKTKKTEKPLTCYRLKKIGLTYDRRCRAWCGSLQTPELEKLRELKNRLAHYGEYENETRPDYSEIDPRYATATGKFNWARILARRIFRKGEKK